MSNGVPSSAAALLTLMSVTWRRFLRGRAVWLVLGISQLPIAMASVVRDLDPIIVVQIFVMGLLPPIFVASAIGEEIEDRTSSYLWSRPLPRWTLLIGKLLALAPMATALVAAGWFVALQFAPDSPPPARSTLAFAAGALAISAISAAIGTLVPKHGTALSIVYLILIDVPVGLIPASVQTTSVTYHVRLLSGLDDSSAITAPAITLAVLTTIWLALALWRVRRLES